MVVLDLERIEDLASEGALDLDRFLERESRDTTKRTRVDAVCVNPDYAGRFKGVRVVIVRWQRIAFTGSGVLAALTVIGAELGAGGVVLALPGLTALMGVLVGGTLWVWATMLSFDRPGDDEEPSDGHGGSKVPDGPSFPPDSDWDQFEAELRDWAREHDPSPA